MEPGRIAGPAAASLHAPPHRQTQRKPEMHRAALLERLRAEPDSWDVIIIGGGATGLATAVDSAARGYRTLLLEQHDFAKGTSSRSTKLIHGGVRYLRQGRLGLVTESLRERRLLLRNAPHLVHGVPFVVPAYSWWQQPFYGLGLKTYGLIAGKDNLGKSKRLSRDETVEHLPTVNAEGLRGGILYWDAAFDDARLAVTMAQTAADLGGLPLNYMSVRALVKRNDRVTGVAAVDVETGEEFEFGGRVVVNATGVFEHTVRCMDDPNARRFTTASQGTHIVLDEKFLPGRSALMVPSADDGRVLFAIPWHDRVILGTTDTPVQDRELEPRPLEAEIEFLLSHAGRYLETKPGPDDALSVFAGLRPLVRSAVGGPTSAIARDHRVHVSKSGLVTVVGGKWTTCRRMGEVTVDRAARVAGLDRAPTRTKALRLHGWVERATDGFPDAAYGADGDAVRALEAGDAGLDRPLHPRLPYRGRDVVWAVREEMARSVEDVLARRTRSLLLDARASMEAAPEVARLIARELQQEQGDEWAGAQVAAFRELAQDYIP